MLVNILGFAVWGATQKIPNRFPNGKGINGKAARI